MGFFLNKSITFVVAAVFLVLSNTMIFAQSLLTTSAKNIVAAICNGQAPRILVLTGSNKTLLADTDGKIPSIHNQLSSDIRG